MTSIYIIYSDSGVYINTTSGSNTNLGSSSGNIVVKEV